MANLIERQITLEGQRNVVVKWAGVLDTSDFTLTSALAVGDCKYNDPQNKLVGFRLDMVEWSISQGLEITVSWNAQTPQLIVPLAGRGRINMWNYGGYVPDQTRPGFDGSINLVSAAYVPGSKANFVITLELIKLYLPR
jgi:hypothetical protein